MMKLGSERITNSIIKVGDYTIEKVWLCKYSKKQAIECGFSNLYTVKGLCRDKEGKTCGWWTLGTTPVLKDARYFAENC